MSRRSEKGKQKKERRKLELLRQCGTCTACCTLMAVDGGALFDPKPAGTPCSKLAVEGQGCSVYASRPQPCRVWSCVWKHGSDAFTHEESPRETGLMFAAIQVGGVACLQVYEVRHGALGELDNALLISRLASKFVVAVVGTTETYGPPELVERVKVNAMMGGQT